MNATSNPRWAGGGEGVDPFGAQKSDSPPLTKCSIIVHCYGLFDTHCKLPKYQTKTEGHSHVLWGGVGVEGWGWG